jgi:hypothetical protein
MKNLKVVFISVISALVLVVLGLVFMNIQQRTEIQEIVEQMEFEKEQLEDEYEELAIQFDGYQTPDIHNDSLVELLSQEKQKVQDLLEELRITKVTNARRIAELKKEFNVEEMDVIMNEWLRFQGKELKCFDGFHYNIYPTSDKYYHESERKKELEQRMTKEFIEGAYKTAEEIKKLLTDNIIKKEKENMKCCKCGKKIDYPATYIKMENATDKNLNKILAVCHDCAYWMISKGDEIDPILLKEN